MAQRDSILSGSQTASTASDALTRTDSMSSSVSSKWGVQYWDRLICLFTGVGLGENPAGTTSVNNKDFFPGPPPSSRPFPPRSSVHGADSVRRNTGSLSRTSMKRTPSQSSVIKKLRHARAHNTSITSIDRSSLQAVPEDRPPTDCNTYALLNAETLATVNAQSNRRRSAEMNYVGSLKDGRTHWIPEYVHEQYASSQSQVPENGPVTPKSIKRPEMKISIPTGHERTGSETDQSRSSGPSSAGWSPHYSSGTSRTSSELATPPDDKFPAQVLREDWSVPCSEKTPNFDAVQNAVRDSNVPTDYVPPLQPRNPRRLSTVNQSIPQRTSIFDQSSPRVLGGELKLIVQDVVDPPDPIGRGVTTCEVASSPAKAPSAPGQSNKSKRFSWVRSLSRRRKPRKVQKASISEPLEKERLPPVPSMRRRSFANDLSNAVPETHGAKGFDHLAKLKAMQADISCDAAESVILSILRKLSDLRDLHAAAQINKGFYSVYQRNKLSLLKSVLYNKSPAAWELREASPKEIIATIGSDCGDYSPKTYLQFFKRDNFILDALKSIILERCQSFLRKGTIEALENRDVSRAAQLDDAFWRIWTFCLLFSSESQCETNLASQMDWLRGGKSHRTSGTSFFGKGNVGGLEASQLYDMTEMWNCLRSLLSGVQGPEMIRSAREYRLFDGETDFKDEASLLEEWTNHLVTLGLSSILDLAHALSAGGPSVFVVARNMGWMKWKRPRSQSSRAMFLKEAVSRVYQEQLASQSTGGAAASQAIEESAARRRRSKDLSRQLRRLKRNTDLSSIPVSEERPISVAEERPGSTFIDWVKSLDPTDQPNLSATLDRYEVPAQTIEDSPLLDDEKNIHPALRRGRSTEPRAPMPISMFVPQYLRLSVSSTESMEIGSASTEPKDSSLVTSMDDGRMYGSAPASKDVSRDVSPVKEVEPDVPAKSAARPPLAVRAV